MTIGGVPSDCLLDTGCELTVLPARLIDPKEVRPTSQKILAANGSDIPVLGVATVSAQVGSEWLEIEGLVSESVFEPMLGIGWLEENDGY